MALNRDRWKVGQTVRFFRGHDKFHELTGKIVKLHEGDTDAVDIEYGDAERVETVHAADIVGEAA